MSKKQKENNPPAEELASRVEHSSPGEPQVMSQDRQSGLFSSFYGSKGKRNEQELEAQKEYRQKLEDRIRQVLVIADTPSLIMPESAEQHPGNSEPIFGL